MWPQVVTGLRQVWCSQFTALKELNVTQTKMNGVFHDLDTLLGTQLQTLTVCT